MSFNPAFGWMQDADQGNTDSKSKASVTKFTATTTDKARFTTSDGATRSSNLGPSRRPSFNRKEGNRTKSTPPPPPPPVDEPSGFDFLSSQDKLQQDLTAMTLKNKSVRATTQARKNLAQKERMQQKRVIDEKVQSARKQLEEEDDQWLKFLMEQREREIREAQQAYERQKARENNEYKTPEQRQEEARLRQERDAERRRNSSSAASFESQSRIMWNAYEEKWASFGKVGNVTLASIPWPPNSDKLLQWAVQQIPGNQDHHAKVKTAYKKCALRWHPDKFLGKYGAKVAGGEEEIEKIRGRLNDNFQSLNASFTRLRM